MIDFSGNTGSLFKRLGKLGAVIANVRSSQNTQYTALTSQATGIVGQLNDEPDIQSIVGAGYYGTLSSLAGSAGPLMVQTATAVVNRAVYRDNPRVSQTLQSQSTLASLQEIIRQMKLAGATVLAQTVTASAGNFSGLGDGALNVSVVRPFDGRTLENAFSETVNLTVTSDSYTGGSTAGQEQVRIDGGGGQVDVFAFDWPKGSGAEININCIDGSQDNSGNNLLTNSGFDEWTANVPDNWTLVTGTAGTNIQQDTGVLFGGTSCLKIIGDASATLTSIRQLFGDSTGTSGDLAPLSQYSFCCWMQRDGIPSSQGTIRFSLTDAAGVIIKDAAGTDNSFTQDLTILPTLYTPVRGCFRTPLILPAAIYLRIDLTVSLDDGRAVFLDLAGLGTMQQLYSSGPFFACHSGGTPFAINDAAQATITNGRGAGGTLTTWATTLQRLFYSDIMSNELLIPSAPAPSISDNLLQ